MSAPTLKELLDRLRPHAFACDCAFCYNFATTRTAIESLFQSLEKEKETWRLHVERQNEVLSRLRATSLTAEEAQMLLTDLPVPEYANAAWKGNIIALRAKLRRIAEGE